METNKAYYDNAYTTSFTAQVISCEAQGKAYHIVLDKTFFYPEGGGQPADIGTLGDAKVTDVRDKNGVVIHITDKPCTVGETVTGVIDWKHRFDLMQNHSGEHILSGLICAAYGCDNVGFHMGRDAILIDFNTKIPEADLPVLEQKANEAIWKNIASVVSYPTPEALEQLEYRSKKALSGKVRIMEMPGYDRCACCGTHVSHTGEIGVIKILSAQNYKGGTRLEIVCGMRALADYAEKTTQAAAISELLSVPTGKIAQATTALLAERDALKQTISRMKWEKMHALAAQISSTEKTCFFVEDFDSKDMVHFADLILDKTNGTTAVFSPAGNGFAFVLMSRTEDMRPLANRMREQLGSKGGGKPESVQGRTEAKQDTISAFLQTEGFSIQ